MSHRLEEEPEEEPEDEEAAAVTPVPRVAGDSREYEYRTELLSVAQVLDGTTLPDRLNQASGDGWDLVDIIAAGEQHAILLRRLKRPERPPRPVGFSPR
jgi:hypothetical protein